MEKVQKQELGWRVSVLPIPAFHHYEPLCVACTQCTVECRNGQYRYPPSQFLFLFFFHPYIWNKNFVTSLYSFYAHAHETTPTSGYKLSHTHIVVEEGP